MSQVRVSVVLLLLFWLGCAFLGQLGTSLDPNHVAVRPFVFVLLAAAMLLSLGVPAIRRVSRMILLAAVLAVYVVGRLTIFDDYPLVGGYLTYLSLSQAALLVVGVMLAQRLSLSVDHVERAVALLCLDGNSGRVRPLHRAGEEIERAMVVARRYKRPLSLVLIEAELPASHSGSDRTVALSLRLGNLVRHLDGSLRRPELILTAPFERRVVLLLGDTDERGAWGLRTHVGALARQTELDLSMSVAVFPNDGLTFNELLYSAGRELAEAARSRASVRTAPDDRQLEAG